MSDADPPRWEPPADRGRRGITVLLLADPAHDLGPLAAALATDGFHVTVLPRMPRADRAATLAAAGARLTAIATDPGLPHHVVVIGHGQGADTVLDLAGQAAPHVDGVLALAPTGALTPGQPVTVPTVVVSTAPRSPAAEGGRPAYGQGVVVHDLGATVSDLADPTRAAYFTVLAELEQIGHRLG